MLQDITLPAFGSSIGEATLLQWLVAPGSRVIAGQVIAEIETDKAVAELEAPDAGVIESIEVSEGTEGVATGTVLARLRVAGPAPRETGTTAVGAESERPNREAAPAAAPHQHQSSVAPANGAHRPTRTLASPFARKLANERNIVLQDLVGSGPGGRIVSRDLPSATASAAHKPLPLDAFGYDAGSYSLAPVTRMRRAIAEGLTRSVREIPGYSLTLDIELDPALALRRNFNGTIGGGPARVSINDLIIRSCAQALTEVPEANRSWTDEGIALHRHANIALAVALDDGIVAPVLRAVESMTLQQVAEASALAIRRSREKALSPAELHGATMTVSNLGMFGVRSFTSILSRPQACILSVGAAEPRPVVRRGELAVATLATFTLTCDHRVLDGASGARFLASLRTKLESPAWLAGA